MLRETRYWAVMTTNISAASMACCGMLLPIFDPAVSLCCRAVAAICGRAQARTAQEKSVTDVQQRRRNAYDAEAKRERLTAIFKRPASPAPHYSPVQRPARFKDSGSKNCTRSPTTASSLCHFIHFAFSTNHETRVLVSLIACASHGYR